MAVKTCPFCQTPFIPETDGIDACPACALTIAPGMAEAKLGLRAVDLREVARYDGRLIVMVAILIGIYLGSFAEKFNVGFGNVPMIGPLLHRARFFAHVVALVVVLQLLTALRRGITECAVYAVLCLLPWIGVLVLITASSQASRLLRGYGIRVGFLGARSGEVARRTDPTICRTCGYSLIGNVSGRCPECGSRVLCRGCDFDLSKIRTPRCPACGMATVWVAGTGA